MAIAAQTSQSNNQEHDSNIDKGSLPAESYGDESDGECEKSSGYFWHSVSSDLSREKK